MAEKKSYRLKLQDNAKVQQSVWPARNKWYEMGVKLKMNVDWLEALRNRYNNDPIECFSAVMKEWLKGARPSWLELIAALRDPTVNFQDLAASIVQKQIDPSAFGVRQAAGFSKPGSTKTFKDKSTQTDVSVHHIWCTCAKCRGPPRYPEPINLRAHDDGPTFPFLNLENLRKGHQEDLEATLVSDANKMIHRFADLIWTMCKSVENQKLPMVTFVKILFEIGAFKEGTRPQVPLLTRHREEITKADSSAEAFMYLIEYFNFVNYHVLEHLIYKVGTLKDQDELDEFLVYFNQYAKRSVFEVQPGAMGQSPNYRSHCKRFYVRLTKIFDMKLERALVVKHKVAEILGMNPLALYISRIEREEGCVQILFLLPEAVKKALYPIESSRLAELSANDMEIIDKPDVPPPKKKPRVEEVRVCPEDQYKILVIGAPRVGKTSLIRRYVEETFEEGSRFWIFDERSRTVEVDGEPLVLSLYDTHGHERVDFYDDVRAVAVVFDLTRENTFRDLDFWIGIVEYNMPKKLEKDMPLILVGNKKDLVDDKPDARKVPSSRAQEFADQHKCVHYMETSAKTAENVDELFANMAIGIVDQISKHNKK